MKIASKEDIYRIDSECSKKFGIPELLLMENAGCASFSIIKEVIPDFKNKRFIVFCGKGNNGGDGAVLARKLFSEGAVLTVIYTEDHKKTGADAALNFSIIEKLGIPILDFESGFPKIEKAVKGSDVLIDAIFGIGFRGEAAGLTARVFDLINNSGKTVVSLDIPSGLSGDGSVPANAVKADFTITFGLPKLPMADQPGREFCGKIFTEKISIPPALLDDPSISLNLLTGSDINNIYRPRARNTSKGNFGHLLIVGGSEGDPAYSGAVLMAGNASLRAGAGLLTVAAPPAVSSVIRRSFPEAISIQISEKDPLNSIKNIEEVITRRKIKSVLAGNGFGTGNFQKMILDFLLNCRALKCLVIDADGLNNLALDEGLAKSLRNTKAETILTPHVGEMARLVRKDNIWVKNNKAACARDFSALNNIYLVLKDAVSFISEPGGQVFISSRGSASLAKGGSGDILAGIIAGLFTSGYAALDACRLGTYLLGRAGELYEEKWGSESALSRDILKLIPAVFKELADASALNRKVSRYL